MPGLSLGEPAVAYPTVLWKSKNEILQHFEGAIVCQGQGERVSLLKDWRERFKIPSKRKHPLSKPIEMQRLGCQKAVAVVVSGRSAKRIHGEISPPTTLSNSLGLPSRSNYSRSISNGTSSATNRMARAISFQDVPLQEHVHTFSVNGASSVKSRKRKVPDSSDTSRTVDRASLAENNPRKVASNVGNMKRSRLQNPGESQRSARRTAALGTGKGGLEVSEVVNGEAAPSGRKRKAESESILSVQPSKRNASVRKPAEAISDETRKECRLSRLSISAK